MSTMKQMARNLDSLGRVVIPAEIRAANGIGPGDLMIITTTAEGILLYPAKDACAICNSNENILKINSIALCSGCRVKLRGRKEKD